MCSFKDWFPYSWTFRAISKIISFGFEYLYNIFNAYSVLKYFGGSGSESSPGKFWNLERMFECGFMHILLYPSFAPPPPPDGPSCELYLKHVFLAESLNSRPLPVNELWIFLEEIVSQNDFETFHDMFGGIMDEADMDSEPSFDKLFSQMKLMKGGYFQVKLGHFPVDSHVVSLPFLHCL